MKSQFFILPARAEGIPFCLNGAGRVQAKPKVDRYARTNFNYCTIEYILKGSGFFEINGQAYQPRQNDIYILQRRSNHSYWPDEEEPWSKIFFQIDGWLVDHLFQAYGLSDIYYVPQCPMIRPYFEEMLKLAEAHPSDLHEKAAVLFHQLLIALQKTAGKPADKYSPPIRELRTFIEHNLARPLSMREMAHHVHKSASHLTRLFKSETGSTPYEYFMAQRMEVAKALLLTTRLPIKDIAARLGFGDQYYFCNAFKKHVRMAPSRYREGRT